MIFNKIDPFHPFFTSGFIIYSRRAILKLKIIDKMNFLIVFIRKKMLLIKQKYPYGMKDILKANSNGVESSDHK